MDTEVAVVGAGPYGLSTAAHLRQRGADVAVFGQPLETWRSHMPAGMLLKSDGFASSLDTPTPGWRLSDYCARSNLAYGDKEPRVQLDTFVDYGLAFQQAQVPDLDTRLVDGLEPVPGGFRLTLEDGATVGARRVVVAVGISHFARVPTELGPLGSRVTHSTRHRYFDEFAGRRVVVVGAGSSAVEVAASLLDVGADVRLVTRRQRLNFWGVPHPNPTWKQRLRNPPSGLGGGWRPKLSQDLPDVFRLLPAERRLLIVRTLLGPASGWWLREKVEGGVQLVPKSRVLSADVEGDEAVLHVENVDGEKSELRADHVIAATGFASDLDRLPFLAPSLRSSIARVGAMPELSYRFESSAPGLSFVGPVAAGSFGPLMRFMVGAEFAAPRVAKALTRRSVRRRRG